MAVNINVKFYDRDYYLEKLDDPAHMKLHEHQDEKKIKWHCNHGEFEIDFHGKNPFNEEDDSNFKSENKKIEKDVDVEKHRERKVYAYSIGPQNPTGEQKKADPGLIVWP